ncbi:serine hydrolase domain-containing protein [Flammeovirga kamogawensis]|uniref:Beta-lactamase family protein n=1 Tax=Flammeovirga kamogawensis TaxID=373891 RepID=A0ABX8H2C5_9BACT|nr:serine hydrolase domain-containing protein [Flammeovirga kamogawensis]MBB6462305.1 CubicO group peptidase (beta-lactamase class C family) [Flammeovirga kamogawensis]QWG09305.1 beta-lactamase family protein [Flammeovirga kamogawensis]TRX64827.1 beta-lactamase family protein [Flammeovirga kamogawensis]
MKKQTTTAKKIFRVVLLISTIISMFFVPWVLVKAWIPPLPDTIQEQLENSLDYGYEGIIVYVDQTGKQPQYFAAGWDNREEKIPAKTDALFKIASISKLYNVVAITKLVKQGRLSLDKTIVDYLPELDGRIENANEITLRLMVQHKSGIPNFTDAPNFWAQPTETYEESLALILDKPANFKPGEDYEYCNTNYLLLSKIMDNVLGYSHFQFIQKEILSPLHLTNTFASLNEVDSLKVMSGYHIGYPYNLRGNEHGMLATAEDVGIFLRALNNGTVFSDGEQEIYSSIYKYEHAGWVPGYQSFANYDKELDAIVIVFYSTTDADLLFWNLSEIINSRIIKILKREQE